MAASTKQGGGGGGSLYYEIANFQNGMDVRKNVLTAPAGTLRLLQNADITQGGEIQKRAAFQLWCAAPAGSIGLASVNNLVYTFLPSGTPGQIDPPTASAVGVIHVAQPKSVIWITAIITGTSMVVTAVSGGSLAVGQKVVGTGVVPGTVIASGAGGVGTYGVNISQNSMPSAVEGPANGAALATLYSYDVYNGLIYAVFQGNDGHMYGYYNGIQVVEATDRHQFVRTYKGKMYGVTGRTLFYSANGDPTVWVDPSPDSTSSIAHNGSGYINMGANDSDSENLIAMEVYYDKMAIFSTLSCQLYFLDPDPSLNQYYQTIRDAGTLGAPSVRQYVSNDVYFLGTHGFRSLRARDLTTTAAVADIGSPIDDIIQDLIAQRGSQYGAYWTKAILSPRTGRIWMCMTDRIYVLSNWASPNISAWSVYIPEFTIDNQHVVYADPYVVLRATDRNIYRYGSTGSLVYDSCPVRFTTPALSFDKPASFKFYQGFDAICTNNQGSVWNVEASFDPSAYPQPWDQICTLDGPTVMDGKIPISGRGTHIQLNITHQAPGPATFSKLFVHYAPSDTS